MRRLSTYSINSHRKNSKNKCMTSTTAKKLEYRFIKNIQKNKMLKNSELDGMKTLDNNDNSPEEILQLQSINAFNNLSLTEMKFENYVDKSNCDKN